MVAKVDQEGCIECGLCVSVCGEVFQFNADGKSESIVDEIPKEYEDAAKEAEAACPVSVISIEE